MSQRPRLVLSALFVLLLCHATLIEVHPQQRARAIGQPPGQESGAGLSQEPGDIVRLNTRVVQLDVLVKDIRTGQPVEDLTASDFQVFDDGRPRALTYFSREGERRRPLALVLVIDMWPSPKAWLAKAAGVMERFAAALTQLPPEDEVSVVTTMFGEESALCQPTALGLYQVHPLRVLQGPTRDRAAVAAALRSVPHEALRLYEARSQSRTTGYKASGVGCLPDEVIRMSVRRPASQVMVLAISDDLGLFNSDERGRMTEKLMWAGAPVYGLITGRSWFGELGAKTYGMHVDRSIDAIQYLARETGGEAVRVRDPEKYVEAFERMIGGLAARYSLGFTLAEDEPDDGRFHKLEVKVKARDARGKERKLAVSARRGYYMPRATVIPKHK